MGKLRFSLTSIIFWVALALSCFLFEDINVFSQTSNSSIGNRSALIMSFSIIGLLVMYFALMYKKNNLKTDKVILALFGVFALLLLWNTIRFDCFSYVEFWKNNDVVNIKYSAIDRLISASKLIIWLGLLYAILFSNNRNQNHKWLAKTFLAITLLFVIISVFTEWDKIAASISGNLDGNAVSLFFGNGNVFGLIILSGIITALILLKDKFVWYYYAIMVLLSAFLFFTQFLEHIYQTMIRYIIISLSYSKIL